jgi:hypothetical protein
MYKGIIISGLCVILSGCGDSGPNSEDIAGVFSGKRIGNFKKISCAKINEATYKCRYIYFDTVSNRSNDEESCFQTSGSSWEAKFFC